VRIKAQKRLHRRPESTLVGRAPNLTKKSLGLDDARLDGQIGRQEISKRRGNRDALTRHTCEERGFSHGPLADLEGQLEHVPVKEIRQTFANVARKTLERVDDGSFRKVVHHHDMAPRLREEPLDSALRWTGPS